MNDQRNIINVDDDIDGLFDETPEVIVISDDDNHKHGNKAKTQPKTNNENVVQRHSEGGRRVVKFPKDDEKVATFIPKVEKPKEMGDLSHHDIMEMIHEGSGSKDIPEIAKPPSQPTPRPKPSPTPTPTPSQSTTNTWNPTPQMRPSSTQSQSTTNTLSSWNPTPQMTPTSTLKQPSTPSIMPVQISKTPPVIVNPVQPSVSSTKWGGTQSSTSSSSHPIATTKPRSEQDWLKTTTEMVKTPGSASQTMSSADAHRKRTLGQVQQDSDWRSLLPPSNNQTHQPPPLKKVRLDWRKLDASIVFDMYYQPGQYLKICKNMSCASDSHKKVPDYVFHKDPKEVSVNKVYLSTNQCAAWRVFNMIGNTPLGEMLAPFTTYSEQQHESTLCKRFVRTMIQTKHLFPNKEQDQQCHAFICALKEYRLMHQCNLQWLTPDQVNRIKQQVDDFIERLLQNRYFAAVLNEGCFFINEQCIIKYHKTEHLYSPLDFDGKRVGYERHMNLLKDTFIEYLNTIRTTTTTSGNWFTEPVVKRCDSSKEYYRQLDFTPTWEELSQNLSPQSVGLSGITYTTPDQKYLIKLVPMLDNVHHMKHFFGEGTEAVKFLLHREEELNREIDFSTHVLVKNRGRGLDDFVPIPLLIRKDYCRQHILHTYDNPHETSFRLLQYWYSHASCCSIIVMPFIRDSTPAYYFLEKNRGNSSLVAQIYKNICVAVKQFLTLTSKQDPVNGKITYYIHTDCHLNNLLITNLEKDIPMQWTVSSTTYEWKTKHKIWMIDFGRMNKSSNFTEAFEKTMEPVANGFEGHGYTKQWNKDILRLFPKNETNHRR